jgi:single-stranded-DNA-specific exonuclease
VPNRADGYGLSKKIIDEAVAQGCTLIITVDNGVTAHEAIKYATEQKVDVVVTDHHQQGGSLPCRIVIDPCIEDSEYPFKTICGCMVAFKFLQELLGKDMYQMSWFKEAFALTAIATIGDVMKLQGENRRFVTSFLNMIHHEGAKNVGVGLSSLFRHLPNLDLQNMTATAVAFAVVPCINAAGRLDDAKQAVELFLTEDVTIADKISKKLVELNNLRKKCQNEVKQNLEVDETTDVIVEVLDNVPHGIIGTVAGTIATTYNKPCYLLSRHNDVLSGSGRSPAYSNFNVGQFVMNNPDICSGGGHKGAGGIKLNIQNLNEFKKRCASEAQRLIASGESFEATKEILFHLDFKQITDGLMEDLLILEPFGEGNRAPLFCTYGVYVDSTRVCGEFKNTMQMEFVQDGQMLKGICFNDVMDKYCNELQECKVIDICYQLQYNYFRGRKTIQLLVEDVRPATRECDYSIHAMMDKPQNFDMEDIKFW